MNYSHHMEIYVGLILGRTLLCRHIDIRHPITITLEGMCLPLKHGCCRIFIMNSRNYENYVSKIEGVLSFPIYQDCFCRHLEKMGMHQMLSF